MDELIFEEKGPVEGQICPFCGHIHFFFSVKTNAYEWTCASCHEVMILNEDSKILVEETLMRGLGDE